MNVKLLISITCAVLLLGTLCSREKKAGAPNPSERKQQGPARVEGAVVQHATIERSTVVLGTLQPFDETVLMPEVVGRVVSVNLPEGKPVAKGTLLVKLFDEDLQAQLRKSTAQRALALQTKERMAELLKVNGVSRTEFDNASLTVTSLDAEMEIIAVQIRKTEVRAPFDGVLGLKRISIGAQVTPSTPLITLRAVKQLKLDFAVPEKYAHDMHPGAAISFTVAELDTVFTATILATEQEITPELRNLPVRAVVNGPQGLTPGQFAKVICSSGSSTSALMIPTNAIIADERKKMVVVCRAGRAAFTPITTGLRRANDVEVVKGLAEGDTVATTGLLFIKPGMPLTFSRIVDK